MNLKFVSILLIITLLVSSVVFIQVLVAEASVAEAKVYIIKLNGVGSWWVDDPSDAIKGAIRAMNVTGENYEAANIPLVHPKRGETPPFYSVNYQVISDWEAFKTVIESVNNAIVLNTHGEILPVPSSYSKEGWADEIAQAMLERQVIWINIGGYPFYYAWYQGQSIKETWGSSGFQEVTYHINKPDVIIPTQLQPELVDLTIKAGDNLQPPIGGWDLRHAKRVSRDRPLMASDFQNYTIMKMWGDAEYYTGAIVAFIKPGERFDPLVRSGFGAFVHIGTNHTYTTGGIETNKDIWRAYVGTAAALWLRMTGFEGRGEDTYYSPYNCRFVIHVTPVILEYDWLSTSHQWQVILGFFVIGAVKRPAGYNIGIETVVVHIDASPTNGSAQLSLKTDLSVHGEGNYSEFEAQIGLIAKSVLFGLSFVPGVGHVAAVLEGVMLFSDWMALVSATDKGSSAMVIEKEYMPEIQNRVDGAYEYLEFQTLIATTLLLDSVDENAQQREQWRIMPINYHFELIPTIISRNYAPLAKGKASLAVYFEADETYSATMFHEDFEDGLDGWEMFDENPASGYDFWGLLPYNKSYYPYELWCAGSSWVENWPQYDNDMTAILQRNIDVRPYQELWLRYRFSAWIKAGDYFKVSYYNGLWHERSYTDCVITNRWDSITIPNDVTAIRFTFESDNIDVDYGVSLEYVEIRGSIPNDANTLDDAGESRDSSAPITVGTDIENYAGYLEDEDWYSFDITRVESIEISLEKSPANSRFFLELWNTNSKVAGPAAQISYEVNSEGEYAVRVFSEIGFGQYDFNIYTTPNNPPDRPLQPNGRYDGYVGESYLYYTCSTDPDLDDIRFKFFWDDGSNTTTGYYSSGDPLASASHTWNSPGTYNAMVRAQDIHGTWSESWSEPLTVTIIEQDGGGGGGGGCPTLFSWNGTAYAKEGLLDIRSSSDVTVDYTLSSLSPIGNLGLISLRELDNHTSHVDYVKLYAVDLQGTWYESTLLIAWHNEIGPVKETLLYDDEAKVDLAPEERAELVFLLPENLENIQHFIFELNGHNRKLLK